MPSKDRYAIVIRYDEYFELSYANAIDDVFLSFSSPILQAREYRGDFSTSRM